MKIFEKNRLLQGFSPVVIFGVAIILVPIFVLMTMDNIREQNSRTIEKLRGKGIFLIRTFEAGTRTGMMTMRWGVSRVQNLLTETALQPEVEYMMITDFEGTVLAHSDPQLVGEKYADMPDINSLEAESVKPKQNKNNRDHTEPIIWHREIESDKDGHKVFQVFKRFTPAHRRLRPGAAPIRSFCMFEEEADSLPESKHNDSKNSGRQFRKRDMDWFRMHFLPPKTDRLTPEQHNQIIFAAIEMSEVEIEKSKYLRHVVAMGFMFLVLGSTGIVGILALQGYRSAKTSISELKGEIERSRRLAAVGKLAAGVAHEIRNPLSSIKGFATYFKERYSNVKDDIEVADIMIQEVERLNRAVTQLLEFAKPLPVETKKINLKELITHSVKLIEYDNIQKNIKVNVDYKLKTDSIVTDPDRLNQILLNLYLNAVQAMDDNGELTIKVFSRFDDPQQIYSGHLEKKSEEDLKNRLIIKIADNGKGIDEKDIEHIFDPYFTTRPEGTGLGLAMVHRAVESIGGEISVKSKKGEGAAFFIILPYCC